MKYFLIVLIALSFSGCLVKKLPPKVEYRINPNVVAENLDAKMCQERSLKVAQAFASNSFATKKMNYVQGEYLEYSYLNSEWKVKPSKAVAEKFKSMIRDSKLFKSVQTSKSRSRDDLILEVTIEDFMQYFNEDSSDSYVNVIVVLTLIDYKTKKVISSEVFQSKLNTDTLDAEGGVKALNKALEDVMQNSAKWLNKVCQ